MKLIVDRVSAAVEAFRHGEMVVVTDDDDRENEGDLFVAASLCTPEKMAFIIRHTSGIVCAPMAAAEARRLRLDPMVSVNDAPLGTAFTVSVDFRHGLRTGISADERVNTVRGLANDNTGAADFVRPGHVFPLIAKDGGVLVRSGHTEACVDLCRLANLAPVGVLAELVNDDGTVQRGPQVKAFAEQHNLHIISVAELIAYRQMRETLVERIAEFPITSTVGELKAVAYRTPFDTVFHVATVYGTLDKASPTPVRLHRANIVSDVFGGAPDIAWALRYFQKAGKGVLVYLRDGAAGVPVVEPPVENATSSEQARQDQWRDIGVGAQILRDLGVSSIELLTHSSVSYVGIAGFDISIAKTVEMDIATPISLGNTKRA
ncbi:MAG: 3,4-dihydroxy-2-butanone-4-phosphate synthase [Alphaproteobacteria bacterium]|nr:3,4-dihydroxy-2-butanone-4-phosphate synthase [Alphaproteobacteria bacterium]